MSTTTTANTTVTTNVTMNKTKKAYCNEKESSIINAISSTTTSSCHECLTPTNTTANTLAMFDTNYNDELLQSTFKWMFWSPHHLVKDDVFFAPSSTILNSSSTSISSWVPTPCLSPVTSPSDFLYDREPLFDGIEQEDDYQQEAVEKKTDQKAASASIDNNNSSITMHHLDDDWSTLFSCDEYDFLPLTPSSTTSTTAEDDDSQSDDNEDYNDNKQKVINQTDDVYSITTTTTIDKPLKRTMNEDGEDQFINCKRLKSTSKSSAVITLFQNLTKLGIDWCRYCGTTEGVNWRPGPWGKRTLCNKHGCDYKGYGLASRLPRLDLSAFAKEKLEERKRPIVQQFCVMCQLPEKSLQNKLIACEGGCSRAYHQECHTIENKYCSSLCHENKQKHKVVVDLPRKYLPLMRLQQQQQQKKLSL